MSADSESAIINKKRNSSYLLKGISKFCQQKHPHASTTDSLYTNPLMPGGNKKGHTYLNKPAAER